MRSIKELSDQKPTLKLEAYQSFINIQNRRNIWLVVGDHYGCIPQEAHDYFHNVWSKQFCEDLTQFKPEINQLIENQFELD